MFRRERSDPRIWLTFLRTRRLFTVLGIAVTVGVCVALFGEWEMGAPSASPGGTLVSLVRLSTLMPGMLPVLLLASPLATLEEAGGKPVRDAETALLLSAFVICAAFTALGAVVSVGSGAMAATVQALIAWFGIALLSGRLLGWRFAWVVPCFVLCVLIYWGFDSRAAAFRWWEFTVASNETPAPAILAVTLLAVGLVAYWLTPWRLCMVARFIRSARSMGRF